MNHLLGVAIVQSISQLGNELQRRGRGPVYRGWLYCEHNYCTHCGCSLLIKLSFSLEFFIQFTTRGILENQVHTRRVVEITKQFQNMWVPGEMADKDNNSPQYASVF